MNSEIRNIKQIKDDRGRLFAIEAGKDTPFEIKRVYCLFDLNSSPRGFHAHKKLKQLMICIKGSVEVILDDGINAKNIVRLDSPETALFIKPGLWREMHNFSTDCIILVFASEHYDDDDYIRSYSDFLIWKKG